MASFEQERSIVQTYAKQYQTDKNADTAYATKIATKNAFNSLNAKQQLQVINLLNNQRSRWHTK